MSERPRSKLQMAVAALCCVALGSLLVPWFTSWVSFPNIDSPWFMLIPVSPFEAWSGLGVAVFNGLLLVLAIRQQAPKLQPWLAASALLALGIECVWRVAFPHPDIEVRMRILGKPRFEWSWLRHEVAIPVLANVGILILCLLRRRHPNTG